MNLETSPRVDCGAPAPVGAAQKLPDPDAGLRLLYAEYKAARTQVNCLYEMGTPETNALAEELDAGRDVDLEQRIMLDTPALTPAGLAIKLRLVRSVMCGFDQDRPDFEEDLTVKWVRFILEDAERMAGGVS